MGAFFVFYLPFLVPDVLLLGTAGVSAGTNSALEGIAIDASNYFHDAGIRCQLYNHHSWFKIIPFHIFILFIYQYLFAILDVETLFELRIEN